MGLTNVAVEKTRGEILSLPFLDDWYPGLLLGILCLPSARGTFRECPGGEIVAWKDVGQTRRI